MKPNKKKFTCKTFEKLVISKYPAEKVLLLYTSAFELQPCLNLPKNTQPSCIYYVDEKK